MLLAALIAVMLTTTVSTTPAAAATAPAVEVTADGSGTVLAGETTTLSVRASNPGATDGFNLGVYLDVPVGIEFVESSMGEPTVFDSTSDLSPAIPDGIVRWVWEDVSDLPSTAAFNGTVEVEPAQPAAGNGTTDSEIVFPVGAQFTVTANAALSGDPTYLPVFGGSTGIGDDAAQAATGTATPSDFTARMVALEINKSEPSPEAELLRGVHDQTTVYTVSLRNTTQGVSADTVVVDYIPAGLEFLGCGAVDNSVPAEDATGDYNPEYADAASLADTPAVSGFCPEASTVDTVAVDAGTAAQFGLTAGDVYTRVEWNLGTLAAGQEVDIHYAAGIPLQENALFAEDAPSAESGEQAANLDNNTGPSTRHGSDSEPTDGDRWTNTAVATSTYQGVVRIDTTRSVEVDDSEVVHAMDLAVVKSIDDADSTFEVGNVADFTLTLRASEYMDSSDIVLTDTLPNGLCPLLPAGVSLIVEGDTPPAACDATGTVTGGEIVSATAHADGTYTVVLRPSDGTLSANGTHTITYQALNREAYVTSNAFGSTTSGDGFSNHVEVEASTDAIEALVDEYPETQRVWDDSDAGIATDLTTISKMVMPRDEVEQNLAEGVDPCTAGSFDSRLETGFQLGDTVCFELRVEFPDSVDVREAIVTDYLPAGIAYAGHTVATESTVVIDAEVHNGRRFDWTLGEEGAGGDLYVARGSVFVAHIWATVMEPSNGAVLDKPANLMKYRQQNVTGDLYSLRDFAAAEITPELGLVKGVASVTGIDDQADPSRDAASSASSNGNDFNSDRDGIEVTQNETVTYRIDLSGAGFDSVTAEVWDLLPQGISADDVSAISGGGTVVDPGQSGYPDGLSNSNDHRSVIVWTDQSVPLGGATLTYDVTIPAPLSVSTSLTNTASIISYAADINISDDPDAQTYFPAGSLNEDNADKANTNGEGTVDDSEVFLPDASITKERTSPTADNNDAGQVVHGEYAEFTYAVTIPAHTSVLNGKLTDAFAGARNWTIDESKTTASLDGASLDTSSTGFALDPAVGELAFPSEYTNDTDADQVFSVTLHAAVASSSNWGHSPNNARRDTATFTSDSAPDITDGADVRVVAPNPSVAKEADDETVTASQAVTYTLEASNSNNRPTSFDTVVTDCVPVELTNVTLDEIPAGTSASVVTDDSQCEGSLITWTIGDLAARESIELKYSVVVSPEAAGGAEYDNTAVIKGYSLDDATADRKEFTRSADADIQVISSGISKFVDEPTARVGEERDFTIEVRIPADVNFYDSAIIDTVPAGISIGDATVSCEYEDTEGDCMSSLPGNGTPLESTGQTYGWWFGDIRADGDIRTLSITYTGTVLDVPSNEDETELVNTATTRWNTTDVLNGAPDNAGYTTTNTGSEATATVTVVEPDVTIAKTVNGEDSDSVEPGNTVNYSITVANEGTAAAAAVKVVDAVPTGVIVDSESITGGGTLTGADSTTGGGTITWTGLTLNANDERVLTYTARLADSINLTDAALTNDVDVTGYSSHAGGPGFDNDERRDYTGPSADAVVTPEFPTPEVTKTTGDPLAYIGENHAFTLVLENTGNGTGTDVTLVDLLPAGFDYVEDSATIEDVVINPAVNAADTGDILTWELADMPAGAKVTLAYKAVATTDDSFDWTAQNTGADVDHTNEATLTMDDTSQAPANKDRVFTDEDDATVEIHRADLAVEKSHEGQPVAGTSTTWTLTVSNSVTSDRAVGPIVITDTLPDSASFEGIDGEGWTTDGPDTDGVLTLTHAGPVEAGGELTVDITAAFAADVESGTSAANTACVGARTFDVVESNDCTTDTDTVSTLADVELSKVATATVYVAGNPITWDMTVTNNGPSVSRSPIVITDTLPASVAWDSVTTSGAGWDCDAVDPDSGELDCTWTGDALSVDADLPDLTVTAEVNSGWTDTVFNTATVFPTTDEPTEPGTDNNTDTATTGAVGTEADLGIDKTVASEELVAGDTGRYRLAITNDGPSDALNVRIADTLPEGLTFAGNVTTADDDVWTCAPNAQDTQQVDCVLTSNAGTLTDGGSTWLEFDVTIDSSVTAEIVNSAIVSSDTEDPDLDNNDDSVARGPFVETNIAVTKEHDAEAVYRAGDELAFTLTVTNDGNADADAVTIADVLPAEMTFVRVDNAEGWTVAGPGDDGAITATLDSSLPAGDEGNTASFDIVVTVSEDAVPTVTNTATVTTTTAETTDEDNSASDDVTVDSPDLVVTKTTAADRVEGGESFTYILDVENVDARAFADGVVVTDVIDPDLAVTSDVDSIGGDDWTCTVTDASEDGFGGTLTCELASLDAGATAPQISFEVAVVDGVAKDQIVNTATVGSDDEHPTKVDDLNESSTTVDIKWINISAQSVCIADVPWFEYQIDARNVDAGLPITVTWYADADGDLVPDGEAISVQTLQETTTDGVQEGAVLWPGAAVDANGVGIAWPGWRPVVAGETPEWENQIVDESLPTYELRNGALAVVEINPETTVSQSYPPATPECEEPRPVMLEVDKTANTDIVTRGDSVDYTLTMTNAGYGATNDVVLSDPISDDLRVTSIDVEESTDAAIADWQTCTVTGRDADGYGGVVECVLDGYTGYGQTSPAITITAQVRDEGLPRTLTNVATVTWTDPAEPDSPAGTSSDDATVAVLVNPVQILATTGISPAALLWTMLGLFAAGATTLIARERVLRR
ncbi:isopeptide-forming domain-containing fimbrial protein [Demequina flava]|uniref:isopeptide-forming domain-containing fimbrial protein n=1 Tax=Demequina flava TaxID=1095025 RepID=UPI0007833B8C|nr:isopeptide-forming domain-containing fimbrial protein [Demequina flava]